MTIRMRLSLALGCLALVALCATGMVAWRAHGDERDARASYEANATADLLLLAAGNWAAERGLTNTALNEPGVATPGTSNAIGQRRTTADTAADAAVSRIAGRPEAAGAMAQLSKLRQAVADLRVRADAAMAQPTAQRPRELLGEWVPGVTALIEASQRLRRDTAFHGVSSEARLAGLQGVKHSAWVLSEYAGRERAMVGGMIASARPMAPEQLVQLGGHRGKVELAWAEIEAMIADPEMPSAVRLAADGVRKAYFADFQTTRAKVYAAGLAGAAYPLDAGAWVAEATGAIDTVLALSRVTGKAAAELAAASAMVNGWTAWGSLGALAFALVVVVGSVSIVTLRVVRPLTRMSDATRGLARGDLATQIPCLGWTDELGGLAVSVSVLRDGMLEKVDLERVQEEARASRAVEQEQAREAAEHDAAEVACVVEVIGGALKRLAAGDLVFAVANALPARYDVLRTDFNTASSHLRATMEGITVIAGSVRAGSAEIAQASEDLSKRTEIEAAGLEQTAAALDQLTATVRQTADGAMHVSQVISEAKKGTERSGEVVRLAVAAMHAIRESSRRISEVTGIIDEMAFQTNLLALNAGVEAARAGDAGRGFAVVASEVRSLAQRSAEAAKEIKALIAASTVQVDDGFRLVGETGEALAKTLVQVAQITSEVVGIASSAQEQSAALNELNAAVNQRDQVTQQNAAMVEETTAASLALAREAEEMAKLTGQFDLGGGASESVVSRTGSADDLAKGRTISLSAVRGAARARR